MTRYGIWIAAAALLGLASFTLGYRIAHSPPAAGPSIWSSGPTITHLESLAQLVSTKVYVADVLVAKDDAYRGAWLIKGDALIAIDLARAEVVQSDAIVRTARVRLPLPSVLAARVDHEKTQTWSVEKTSWVPFTGNPDGLRDEAMRQAQKLVEFAARSDENLEHARNCAESVIRDVYRMVDWQVTVEWEQPEPGK